MTEDDRGDARRAIVPRDWQRREVLYDPVITVLDAVLRLTCSVRVGGHTLPARGPVLLVANHVAYLDAVVFGTVVRRLGRRARFLALAELWDVPVVNWMLRHGRMIPVWRGAGPQHMVANAGAALAAGQAVLVYPEGHIARGRRLPALPGAGLLALTADAPVVPIAVWGLGSPDRPRRVRLRRRLGVMVGAPVDLSSWGTRTDRAAARGAADAVLGAVRALLPAAEQLTRRGRRRRRRGGRPAPRWGAAVSAAGRAAPPGSGARRRPTRAARRDR